MLIDRLISKCVELKNPVCVGLDTSLDYLPEDMQNSCKELTDAAKAITEFNIKIIDRVHSLIPAVKVQIAYYEMYGVDGIKAFLDTINYAKKMGLIVISDVKRNDILSTASCYSSAYLGNVKINGNSFCAFPSDFITVNGYLGTDGISPFITDCKEYDKGIFVLVKTSNPSSFELQDKKLDDGQEVYKKMAGFVNFWGKDLLGKYNYSQIGAVVGATQKSQAKFLRDKYPNLFFLIPGYGAQGATASDLTVCFDESGCGGIVNSSRGILCAYKSEKFKSNSYAAAAEDALIDMQQDIYNALKNDGKEIRG
ncbi:MAG: orotidine-5'-phosphate decarboxylase [Firmicutes bacterium]|nr:orotidine-5'-phosphate decarboxylase [Bacillota bacterium]